MNWTDEFDALPRHQWPAAGQNRAFDAWRDSKRAVESSNGHANPSVASNGHAANGNEIDLPNLDDVPALLTMQCDDEPADLPTDARETLRDTAEPGQAINSAEGGKLPPSEPVAADGQAAKPEQAPIGDEPAATANNGVQDHQQERSKSAKARNPKGKRKPKNRPPNDDDDPLSIFHQQGQTDLANARRFVRRHGDKVRYCQPWNQWMIWDGKRWKRDDTGAVELLAKDVPDDIFRAALAFDDTETMRFGVRSASSRSITAMLSLAESEPGVAVLPDEFDRELTLLNCANGVLDLRTGELLPHDPTLLCSKLCPTAYAPEAASYEFEKCLEGIFAGKQPLIDFLRRLMGMCLSGETTEEILPILYGTGSNGKTLLLKLFMSVIGTDYSMTANC